jgi:hypothetical protein
MDVKLKFVGSHGLDNASRFIGVEFAVILRIAGGVADFLRSGNFLVQRFNYFVESRADCGVRNASLLGDLLQVAAGKHEDFDKTLVLDGQVRQPRCGEGSIHRDAAALAGHATDRHGRLTIWAKIRGEHGVTFFLFN